MWLTRDWYRFTMYCSRVSHPVKSVDSLEEIPPLFDWGRKYLSDPLKGKLDYLAHPSLLEKRSDFLLPFGDCDDHALFYGVKLKISGLADRVWFCIYTMADKNKRLSGHAVCVFTKNGSLFWCDYRHPNKLGRATKEKQWDFAMVSASVYGKRPIAAARWEIMGVEGTTDTPIFGPVEANTEY